MNQGVIIVLLEYVPCVLTTTFTGAAHLPGVAAQPRSRQPRRQRAPVEIDDQVLRAEVEVHVAANNDPDESTFTGRIQVCIWHSLHELNTHCKSHSFIAMITSQIEPPLLNSLGLARNDGLGSTISPMRYLHAQRASISVLGSVHLVSYSLLLYSH
jgi:hypothetical protein